MNPKVLIAPVRTEVEHAEALKRIEELFDAPDGSLEFDEFDILTILVHDYERKHRPSHPVEPAATLRHYLDRMELLAKDLEPYIGTKSMVSMVLNGQRPLTVKMIRNLHEGLGIPLEVLVGSNALEPPVSPNLRQRA